MVKDGKNINHHWDYHNTRDKSKKKRRKEKPYLSGLDGLELLSLSKLPFFTKDFSIFGKTEKGKKG